MHRNNMYRLGIDIGSKTAKMVLLNEKDKTAFSQYSLHRSNVLQTFSELLGNTIWRFGDHKVQVCVTGSAGMRFAQDLGLPYAQEVIASRRALQTYLPQVDVAIELGGEDAKILFLRGSVEERMNGSCAGGTGGFLDLMCGMLSVKARDFNALAAAYTHIYPIASRCAVFAQADVRPLINAGARKSDIAASVMQAIVTQTISGLACGRTIEGNVAFLGGPCEVYSELVQRFRATLGLTHSQIFKPHDAHLFVASGAALIAGDRLGIHSSGNNEQSLFSSGEFLSDSEKPLLHEAVLRPVSLSQNVLTLQVLKDRIDALPQEQEGTLGRLPALFASEKEHTVFKERHAKTKIIRSRIMDHEGDIFIGVDAGSTTLKLVAINTQGELLYSAYENNKGDVIDTMRVVLDELYRASPHEYDGTPLTTIRRSTVCGYGEDLLKAAFRMESGEVETVAHLRAAREICPDASFVLDIGGQDIKCLRLEDGKIDDIMLNEACSSGCGALIQGFARSLGHTKWTFAEEALTALSPVDLGTRCTVFMTSRVRHAQKEGVSTADISAGLAYSVVRNALYKVMAVKDISLLGTKVVVQGGTFMNDAVLRAFELESGLEVIRPDIANLMGAYGAALLARDEYFDQAVLNTASVTDYQSQELRHTDIKNQQHKRADEQTVKETVPATSTATQRSTILNAYELATLKQKKSMLRCAACANACNLAVSSFTYDDEERKTLSLYDRLQDRAGRVRAQGQQAKSDPGMFVSGNRCERGALWTARKLDLTDLPANRIKPTANLMAYEQRLRIQRKPVPQEDVSPVSLMQEGPDSGGKTEPDLELKPKSDLELKPEPEPDLELKPEPEPELEPESEPDKMTSSESGTDHTQSQNQQRENIPLLGIPPVLDLFEHSVYWQTLFSELGFSVLPMTQSSGAIYRQGASAVLSETVCYPAKLMHGHIYGLISKGAEYIFMPTFEKAKGRECPVASSYGHLASHDVQAFSEGKTTLLATALKSSFPRDTDIRELVGQTTLSVSDEAIKTALTTAGAAEQYFLKKLWTRAEEELEQLEREGGTGIVLLGHPYHSDPGINHSIDTLLGDLGYAVFSAVSVERAAFIWSKYDNSDNQNTTHFPASDWQQPARLYRIAQFVASHPRLHAIQLHSFGCGADALTLAAVRHIIQEAQKPYTAIKLDEMVEPATLRIRLRSLDYALNHSNVRFEHTPYTKKAPLRSSAIASNPAHLNSTHTNTDSMPETSRQRQSLCSMLPPVTPSDVGRGLSLLDNDLCYQMLALGGQILRWMEEHDGEYRFVLPFLCKSCRGRELEKVVNQALPAGTHVYITSDTTDVPLLISSCESFRDENEGSEHAAPHIGVLGNAAMLLTPEFNNLLLDKIKKEGAIPVLPSPKEVFASEQPLPDLLPGLYAYGIRDFIFVQSFGCMRSHVGARGVLPEIKTQYSDCNITFLEYDPGISQVNQLSRLKLAVAIAFERLARRSTV